MAAAELSDLHETGVRPERLDSPSNWVNERWGSVAGREKRSLFALRVIRARINSENDATRACKLGGLESAQNFRTEYFPRGLRGKLIARGALHWSVGCPAKMEGNWRIFHECVKWFFYQFMGKIHLDPY